MSNCTVQSILCLRHNRERLIWCISRLSHHIYLTRFTFTQDISTCQLFCMRALPWIVMYELIGVTVYIVCVHNLVVLGDYFASWVFFMKSMTQLLFFLCALRGSQSKYGNDTNHQTNAKRSCTYIYHPNSHLFSPPFWHKYLDAMLMCCFLKLCGDNICMFSHGRFGGVLQMCAAWIETNNSFVLLHIFSLHHIQSLYTPWAYPGCDSSPFLLKLCLLLPRVAVWHFGFI